MREAVAILSQLVSIDSVSARSNRPIVDVLSHRLEALGARVRTLPYRDDRGVEKLNLVATLGPGPQAGGAVELALVGHTDTVPYDPAWADALVLTERDGKLFGRGSADTKGFIAAALVALARVGPAALRRPLACVFTADEEIGCVGARRLAEEGGLRPRHAIVGEPTELTPVRAHKGYWLAEVNVEGTEAHSAYPHLGRSAILDAARVLVRVEAVARGLEEDQDPLFAPPFTTINVGTIAGGKARNVIPGSCTFPVEWRPIPGQDGELVARRLRCELDALHAADGRFRARLEVVRRDPGVQTPAGAEIVRFLEAETGKAAATIPFGTELPHVTALGAEGCICGPGDIRVAHRTGEFVPRAELERAVELLERAIRRFCC